MRACSKCNSHEVLETTALDLNNYGEWIIGDTRVYCIDCGNTDVVQEEK